MAIFRYIVFFLFVGLSALQAQTDTLALKTNKQLQLTVPKKYNPLSPAKAAFYSAILPGAGQIYNNRYWWQLPAIYGGLGASIYYYSINSRDYNRFRTAFKIRKAGLKDEFTDANGNHLISTTGLESAQRQLRENRDTSLLMIILVYVLQITEASVRAHLLQFNTSKNLSVSPSAVTDPTFYDAPKMGLTLKYSF